ncbi:hypothetical protein PtB15_9B694 [Puccinia triticina]|nr:hypothetical protein PtB15_9B694 [Puccinia triticina]
MGVSPNLLALAHLSAPANTACSVALRIANSDLFGNNFIKDFFHTPATPDPQV